MADDLGEAEDERAIELATISAIYPELTIDPSDSFTAEISIPIDPIKPVAVRFPPLSGAAVPDGLPTPPKSDGSDLASSTNTTSDTRPLVPAEAGQEVHELAHLPPVKLQIHLPSGYPDTKPANLKIVADVPWLPEVVLERLRKSGESMWEDMGCSQMLFAYIDFLREEAENGFDLPSSATEPLQISPDLEIMLLDFDIKAKRAEFEKATFECGVCLEPKKGAICHRISRCAHVFCVECLQDFYNNCITEGDVGSVKCIAPKCGQNGANRRKRDKTLGPSELLQIPLEQSMVQRYIKLKRKNALESDRTTVYCPRPWCQGPARSKKTEALDRNLDGESDDEGPGEPAREGVSHPDGNIPPAERLAICTECTFAFCKVCKASWHGEFVICDPQRKAQVTDEEKASEEYMRMHTSPCPTCNARCQKTHGCNHMICYKCSSHFCYLCSSWLDSGNPYQHFNDPKKPCHMRLWELEAGDGADVGRGFAGGFGDDESDDDGQDDNPLEDLDDVDSDDEAELPRAPIAPLANPRHRRRAQNIVVRLPPARIQAAIARRAGAAPAAVDGVGQGRVAEPPVPQPGPANARAPPPPPPGLVRRRPIEGMQRFLDLALNDEEDEWDSDELDDEGDDENFWHIPIR
ncbi:MAG: hypothetical protein LQ346_007430 [Caloplaca aetnensis]|nr:MAG: hypothetical protein LQ346_007430 [Caloplaca aetnensis]